MTPPSSRVALVTGAASGIGEGTAHHLARLGHSVAVIDRDARGADRVAADITASGGRAIAVAADVSSEHQVQHAVAITTRRLGGVAILVNNAGFGRNAMLVDMSTPDWDDVLATHLRGTFLFTRAVLPAMKQECWGRIVNISSISALAEPNRANYVSAKAGIEAFTKAIAHELAPDGITANAIGPGVVVTGMTALGAAQTGRTLDEHVEVLRRTIAIGRVGTPHDIARTVAFFADDEADFITGQVLYVSGAPHG
ncbi:MAG: SDR family oxidoreductase [Actinomycetota bacterium]|nr:SDR family oxidoreductase [Actinomycetota bacterium]